jgi:hypothetical protein
MLEYDNWWHGDRPIPSKVGTGGLLKMKKQNIYQPPSHRTNIPTNKGNKMATRFRVEIYDEVKNNDVTIYSEQGVDKEYLTELVYSNISKFDGNVKAFVFDTLKKKKTTAVFVPIEITQSIKSRLGNTAKELGLA